MDPYEEQVGIARVFAQLAVELHEEPGVEETVEAIVRFAVQAIKCERASLVLRQAGGRLDLIAATDPAAEQEFALQLGHRQGPSLVAVGDQIPVVVPDTVTEQRWPAWAAATATAGVRSMLSIPFHISETLHGALNLAADKPYAFEPADEAVAEILTRHAAVAVAAAREEANLWQAADTRKLIGQAQGILMERFHVDDDRAFAILRRYSQDTNTKLSIVARDLIATRKLPD